MRCKSFLSFFILVGLFPPFRGAIEGQDGSALHVVVNMVQLNVAVTDKDGNYVTGLHPEDFVIMEDGITEKLATFAEGDAPARNVVVADADDAQMANATGHSMDHATDPPSNFSSLIAGSNIFILFDTSNYMYRDFVFAEDAITEFVHSLESANKIAFYSYSRDLSRAALLTSDRLQVLRGVRSSVAGDSAALY